MEGFDSVSPFYRNTFYRYMDIFQLAKTSKISTTVAQEVAHQIQQRFANFTINQEFREKCRSKKKLIWIFKHLGPSLETLTIQNLPISYGLSHNAIACILSKCPNLQKLEFIGQDLNEPNQYFRIGSFKMAPIPKKLRLSSLRSLMFNRCRVSDTILERYVANCTGELENIELHNTIVTGEFLMKAPVTVSCVKTEDSIDEDPKHFIEYFKRNPNLNNISIVESCSMDLANIFSNLRNVVKLSLESEVITNYAYLAKLYKLELLCVIITDNLISEYFDSITSEHSLYSLHVVFGPITVSPELAKSFEKLCGVEELILDKPIGIETVNIEAVMPHLRELSNLKVVQVCGDGIDLKILCKNVPQIEKLIITVHVDSMFIDNLFELKNLRSALFEIKEQTDDVDLDMMKSVVNRLFMAISHTESLYALILEIPYRVELEQSTLNALKASNVKRLTFKGLCRNNAEAIRLISSFPHLELYMERGQDYTREEWDALKAIPTRKPIIFADYNVDLAFNPTKDDIKLHTVCPF